MSSARELSAMGSRMRPARQQSTVESMMSSAREQLAMKSGVQLASCVGHGKFDIQMASWSTNIEMEIHVYRALDPINFSTSSFCNSSPCSHIGTHILR